MASDLQVDASTAASQNQGVEPIMSLGESPLIQMTRVRLKGAKRTSSTGISQSYCIYTEGARGKDRRESCYNNKILKEI